MLAPSTKMASNTEGVLENWPISHTTLGYEERSGFVVRNLEEFCFPNWLVVFGNAQISLGVYGNYAPTYYHYTMHPLLHTIVI